jgi:hypothetical protein
VRHSGIARRLRRSTHLLEEVPSPLLVEDLLGAFCGVAVSAPADPDERQRFRRSVEVGVERLAHDFGGGHSSSPSFPIEQSRQVVR